MNKVDNDLRSSLTRSDLHTRDHRGDGWPPRPQVRRCQNSLRFSEAERMNHRTAWLNLAVVPLTALVTLFGSADHSSTKPCNTVNSTTITTRVEIALRFEIPGNSEIRNGVNR